MPSGGSLTADQWMLLATVYAPIVVSICFLFLKLPCSNQQVPQLWSTFFLAWPGGDHAVLSQCIFVITKNEAEKEHEALQKVQEHKDLAKVKAQGKEAFALVKARITQEHAVAAEAKKVEKLRAMAECQEKKARIAAEKKKVRVQCLIHVPGLL